MLAATTLPEAVNTTYLLVYVVIGAATLIGFAVAAARWLRRQGAAEARLNVRLDTLERALKPNGLDTDQIGDMVKRTENKVDAITSKLDQHIGASDQVHRELWRAVRSKEDKR